MPQTTIWITTVAVAPQIWTDYEKIISQLIGDPMPHDAPSEDSRGAKPVAPPPLPIGPKFRRLTFL